ncbi:CynX/NimT family MFS transporter [Nitriliruptor alkaliphilus]|uniref:CynX/NimT family MFS transporter n=1 Tax=Nitriliruptor alkaliphilus TaxID=427918 RepID=UPI000697E43C|nr:MFS transporter [Nitriliruptor alkaliphilus]
MTSDTGSARDVDRRWAVGLATLALVLTAANLRPAVTSLGAILPEVRAGTGTSGVVAGILTSLPPVCFGVAALLGARVGRRFGTAQTLLGAMLVTGAMLALRATSGSGAAIVGWSIGALVAMGIGNALLPVVVKRWFPGRVGDATGWYAVALAAGTAAAAGLTVPIADATTGWRIGLGVWAVPALLAAVPWWWLRERRHRPPGADGGLPEVPRYDHAIGQRVRRQRRSWALAGYFGSQSLAAYVVMGWLPSIYRDAGVTPATAGSLLAVLMLVGGPVSLLVPAFAGRRADQRPLVAVLAGAAATGFSGLLLAPAAAPWVWAVLIGIGMGAFPLALTLIGLRARTTDGTAALSSLGQGVGYLLAAGGPVLFGLLHDVTDSWDLPLTVLIALLGPQLVCGLIAARPGTVD